MEYTPNYNLKMPTYEEFGDVTDLNDNAKKIDAALKALSEALGGIDLTTIQNQLTQHLADSMPHLYVDNGVKYRWGFRTVNGEGQFIYEEVV